MQGSKEMPVLRDEPSMADDATRAAAAGFTPSPAQRRGDHYRGMKSWTKAAHYYAVHVRRHPADFAIWVQQGNCLKEAGSFEQARDAYDRAITLNNGDFDVFLQKGHLLKLQNRLQEAIAAYRQSLRLQPLGKHALQELLSLRAHSDIAKALDEAMQADGRSGTLNPTAVAAIHVRCGDTLRDTADFAGAEAHYQFAKQLIPDDPDLVLRFGDLYKIVGRLKEAELAYRGAIDLAPGWPEPAIHLAELYRAGWRNHTIPLPPRPNEDDRPRYPRLEPSQVLNGDGLPADDLIKYEEFLLPELAPHHVENMLRGHDEDIAVRWFGHYGRTPWGMRDVVRGIDAIRGFCVSATPIVEVRACLNGLQFHSEAPKIHPLKYEKYNPALRKYVFNIWHDFSHFREGLYEGQLYFVDAVGGIRSHTRHIVIAPPLREEDYPNSDRLVSVLPDDNRSLEEKINSRPSMIRPARRPGLMKQPKNILILRVDQLGDMVISISALRRLRELFPNARVVGLLSPANADLAKTLGLFDEIITIDFVDDAWHRRRILSLPKQYELQRQLRSYNFDVAIDFAEAFVSRPLLLLSGAPFLYGFSAPDSPWLTAHFEGWHIDPLTGSQTVPLADKTLGLVEWLAVLFGNHAPTIRRNDLHRERLAPYGLASNERFAVLHTGARLKFSQWPHYPRLAEVLLERTDLNVVMMTDDPTMAGRLDTSVISSDRFLLIDKKLPFDDFDALLSFAVLFVGNDSGPSHLAALRGTPVINLFMARHAWNEWGHENHGYIISRRVPCSGCVIHDDPEECGKEFSCITNITTEEVFQTAETIINGNHLS